MEPDTMGIVLVSARIENLYDVKNAEDGLIPADQVRRIEVNDARVDNGATYVSMPMRLINQLGLKWLKTIQAKTVARSFSFGIFER
ncbi:MAG: hypothetical protein ACLQVF_34205 [Isosphaeraceae bacterium]